MKYQNGLFFHTHFAKSAFCVRNMTLLSSHAAPALAVNVFNVCSGRCEQKTASHVAANLCDKKMKLCNTSLLI